MGRGGALGRIASFVVAFVLLCIGLYVGLVPHYEEPGVGESVVCGSAFSPADPPRYSSMFQDLGEFSVSAPSDEAIRGVCNDVIPPAQGTAIVLFGIAGLLVILGFVLPSPAAAARSRSQGRTR